MRRIIAFFVVVILLGLGLAYRVEAKKESLPGVSLKIGYVNRGKVIDKYPKAREVEDALRKEEEAKRKELMEKQEAIKKLEEELKAQGALLKEEEKQKKIRIIEEEKGKLGQLFRKYNAEMRSKVFEKQKEVLKEVDGMVESFGKEKGYTLILDAEQVIYGLEGLDVTGEIIKLFKKK